MATPNRKTTAPLAKNLNPIVPSVWRLGRRLRINPKLAQLKIRQKEARAKTKCRACGSELRWGNRADMGRSSAELLFVGKKRPLQKAAATQERESQERN